jgi:hypothetical protein
MRFLLKQCLGNSIFSAIVAESSSISTFRNDCREYRVAIALPRQICYTGNFITRASNAMKFNPLRCRREKKIARHVTAPVTGREIESREFLH